MSALRTIAWHLTGFAIFGGMSWGALTLILMMPDTQYWWPAWAIAGATLIKVALFVATLMSGYLAFAWLFKPAELD